MQSKSVEGRIAIFSALLLTASIYISGFSLLVSALSIIISLVFCPRIIRSIILLSPMLIFFVFSSYILGGIKHSLNMSVAMLAILSSGLLVSSVPVTEFSLSLKYFGFPESWAFRIGLAIRMFEVFKEDVRRCFEASKLECRGVHIYLRALKSFSAVIVLRSVALAESLYCKGYSGKLPGELRKPNFKDFLLLLFSAIVLITSLHPKI
ncbi:MAG: hypothetical protein DSY33_00990 [Archaeoglobus sp.]|nr:MAG: hypothetical protein DSY33_00990 [Archaeoglobus sp.]